MLSTESMGFGKKHLTLASARCSTNLQVSLSFKFMTCNDWTLHILKKGIELDCPHFLMILGHQKESDIQILAPETLLSNARKCHGDHCPVKSVQRRLPRTSKMMTATNGSKCWKILSQCQIAVAKSGDTHEIAVFKGKGMSNNKMLKYPSFKQTHGWHSHMNSAKRNDSWDVWIPKVQPESQPELGRKPLSGYPFLIHFSSISHPCSIHFTR